jgi:nucleoside-diphosphate-sugar epimerase
MNSKLAIFGGTGFIGNRFCELYSNNIEKIPRNIYKTEAKDIVYFISTVDNYNVHTDLHIDVDTNLTVLLNVLNEIKDRNDREDITFNFISSWFVYGKNHEIPFREDFSKCSPTGFYSITKYCAEQLLISFCETFNIKYRILRLANVIGEGDTKISKKKNALQFLIKEIVYNNEIPLYYGGEVLRDYIYVDDVCDAIDICLKNAPDNEIINIGSGKPYRFIDIINDAIKYSNSKSIIKQIKPTNFHNIVQVRHSYLDISKLSSYGFVLTHGINDIVKRLVDHYKSEQLK